MNRKSSMRLLRLWGHTYQDKLGKSPRELCKELMKEHGIPSLKSLNDEQLQKFLNIFMDAVKSKNHDHNEALRKLKTSKENAG